MNQGIRVDVMTVTPTLAAEWLGMIGLQRPLSMSTVRRYAALMTADRWMVGCDAVGFSRDGQLVNGQHRLQAIISSDKPQTMLVVWGLAPEVFEVLDAGKKRQAGEVLAILGYKNCNTLAAVAKRYAAYLRAGKLAPMLSARMIENDEVVATVAKHPDLCESVNFIQLYKHQLQPITQLSPFTFVYHLFAAADPDRAQAVVEQIAFGENLKRFDAARLLRERLIRDASSKSQLDRSELIALLVKTFNAAMRGEEIKALKWTAVGRTIEPYPQPRLKGLGAGMQTA